MEANELVVMSHDIVNIFERSEKTAMSHDIVNSQCKAVVTCV